MQTVVLGWATTQGIQWWFYKVDRVISYNIILSNLRKNAAGLSPPPLCRIYASMKWISIDSGNGLSPSRRQAITWTNAPILLIGPLGANFQFKYSSPLKKIHLKISSAKWRPFCPMDMSWVSGRVTNCKPSAYVLACNSMLYQEIWLPLLMGPSQQGHRNQVSMYFCQYEKPQISISIFSGPFH